MAMNYDDDDWNDDDKEFRGRTVRGGGEKKCSCKLLGWLLLGGIIGIGVIVGVVFLIIFIISEQAGQIVEYKIDVWDDVKGGEFYDYPNSLTQIRIIGQHIDMSNYKGKLKIYINGTKSKNVSQFVNLKRKGTATIKLVFEDEEFRKNDFKYFFRGLTYVKSINFKKIDTHKVENMDYAFSQCVLLTSIDLSRVSTRKVKYMEGMFEGDLNLISINFDGKPFSKVKTMQSMFSGCRALRFASFEGINTGKVTSFGHMFHDCGNLTELDLTHWKLSQAEDFENMFGTGDQLLLHIKKKDYNKINKDFPNTFRFLTVNITS